ncbi:hypothetical protein PDE_00508 [Penicillium oxalicum 114-2]|uniref:Apple domain-containing protein n=1 Tax=Penicillium oxalicum (strain 114-2 / CGMCC 5302) TaxID=933388 RepID=S7Z620_PENO1|nr:hypothetical protein PDE_00508 [Penicillium oxalicum 114-2]
MHLFHLLLGAIAVTGVVASTTSHPHPHPQVPICHQCEEKKDPTPAIPRCGTERSRPKLFKGQCTTTYRCAGHCGLVKIPQANINSLNCDYAEVTVGPDGSIIDECCDPPECPNQCPTNPCSDKSCSNDPNGCPSIDGSIHQFGGRDYIYHCNKGFCSTSTCATSSTETLKECAEKCSRDPSCKMISYHDKTCTLAMSVGSVIELPGSVVLEPVGPSPKTHHDGDCAHLHGTTKIIHGLEFKIHCDTRLGEANVCKSHTAASLEDCAAQCASDSQCHGATFSEGHCCLADKKVHPSKQPGSIGLEPLPGYGCPYVDWAVKEIGGVRYEFHCNAWLESGGTWTQVHAANEVECALQCSKNKKCTGVSLRGQQCYLATAAPHLQPRGNWVAMVPLTGHQPGVIDPPPGPPPPPPPPKKTDELHVPECKAAHGQVVQYKGHSYSIDCYRWVGGDGFTTATKHSLADCIKMCADHANCVAMHYLPSQQFCAIHDNIPRVGTQGDFGVAYVRRVS